MALITGASRGIGVFMARALAARGMRVALAARSADALHGLQRELEAAGHVCIAIPMDLGDRASVVSLVEQTERRLGPVEVLVNNAGIEHMSMYEQMPLDEVDQFIDVNLRAPMWLSRLVLPGMMARDSGHIVNIASLAGLAPAAFGEPYGATKHGLVGFTRALRASLKTRKSNVSASVICPGFVSGVGMFEDMRRRTGMEAPKQLGTFPAQGVAQAVLQVIDEDAPEVVLNGRPIRPLLAIGCLWPRFMEWIAKALGANEALYETARVDAAQRASGGRVVEGTVATSEATGTSRS